MVKITVAIPVYNAAEHLHAGLDSLAKQTMDSSEFEIICVNDQSTDHSKEVIKKYQQKMENLILIDRETNSGGPMIPRNDAINAANGKYILFLDNDDYLGEETLERFYHAAEQNHSDVIFGKYIGVNGRKVPQSMFKNGNRLNADIVSDNIVYSLAPHKMFNLDFLRENHFTFHPKAVVGEDQLFVMQCYIKAKAITVLADYDYYYVVARGNENLSLKYFPAEQFFFSFNHIMSFIEESDLNPLYKKQVATAFLNRFLHASRLRGQLFTNRLTFEQKKDWLNETKRFIDHHVTDELIPGLKNRFKYFIQVAKENNLDKLLLIHNQIGHVSANDVTRIDNGSIYARLSCYSKKCSYDEEHVVNQFNTSDVFVSDFRCTKTSFTLTVQMTQSLLINFENQMKYTLKLVHRKSGIEKSHLADRQAYGVSTYTVDFREILFDPKLTGAWDLFIEAEINSYVKRRRIGSARSSSIKKPKKLANINSFDNKFSIEPYYTKPFNNISLNVENNN